MIIYSSNCSKNRFRGILCEFEINNYGKNEGYSIQHCKGIIDGVNGQTEISIENQEAQKHKFHAVLNEVQNHMFVTKESEERRSIMRFWVDTARSRWNTDRVVFFPTGSVATGMSKTESDIDGVVLYSADEEGASKINEDFRTIDLPEKYNPFMTLSRVEDRIENFFENIDNVSLQSEPRATEQVALFFAPSLSESINLSERNIVDSWRKNILEKLSKLPNDKGEFVWSLIEQYLERQFVHYEDSFGGETKKRTQRVGKILSEKIAERFPDFEGNRDRARRFIESKRENFHYPSFEEMKLAFGV